MEYSEVQRIARNTIEYIKGEIHSGMALTEVRRLCEEKISISLTRELLKNYSDFVSEVSPFFKRFREGVSSERFVNDISY